MKKQKKNRTKKESVPATEPISATELSEEPLVFFGEEEEPSAPGPATKMTETDTTVFFDEGEDEPVPQKEPAQKESTANTVAPRPSLRFRVKRVYHSGEPLPEGTRLALASKSVKALKPDAPSKSKKTKKEKSPKALVALSPKKKALPESACVPAKDKAVSEEASPKKVKAKLGLIDYIRYAMLFFCFTVFLYSSYTLVDSLISRAKSRTEYDQLSNTFHAKSPFMSYRLKQELPNVASVDLLSAYVGVQPEEFTPIETDEDAQVKIDKVTFLKNNKNKDTMGWIIIPGTNIDYPLVHTKDNDYYLRRSFYGKSNLAGTLFADNRNSKKLMENRNTVIYGHNMNDGSMFNNLHDLRNEAFFRDCKIEISTPNGVFIYEVFSVHEALETSEYFQCTFQNDAHFASWLEEMKGESLFQKEGLELAPGDKVLTLSTCLDPIIQSEYRWAVHAKLVEIINYIP